MDSSWCTIETPWFIASRGEAKRTGFPETRICPESRG